MDNNSMNQGMAENQNVETSEQTPSYVNGQPQYNQGGYAPDGRAPQAQAWEQVPPESIQPQAQAGQPQPQQAQPGQPQPEQSQPQQAGQNPQGGYQNPYSAGQAGGGYQNPYSAKQPEGFTNAHTTYQGAGADAGSTSPNQGTQYQNYGGQSYQSYESNGYNGYGAPASGSAPEFILWLILGIVQIPLGCCSPCCLGFVTGIVTIVFICLANSAYKSGDVEKYKNYVLITKVANLVGWGLLVLNIVLTMIEGIGLLGSGGGELYDVIREEFNL